MKKRRLGYTDFELSPVGLGTWAMGGGGWSFGWGPQDDEESVATIRYALGQGVNWIDTAPVYGLGHSEKVVGRAIKGLREKVIIATKCGLVWDERGKISGRLKRKSIRREVEESLKRLEIEVIDLYQIHWPDPDRKIEEAWSTMADLVREGKVRYMGVSNFNVKQLERIRPIHPIASLQPPYSMLNRGIEDELLNYCKTHDIGIIVYSPMECGLLTGKYTKESIQNLPEDDWRRTKNSHFQEPELSANLKLIEGLYPIAEKNGKTIAQLAVAWVLRRPAPYGTGRSPEVTSAIVGARRPSQIEETVRASEWALSKEDIATIESLLEERKKARSSYG